MAMFKLSKKYLFYVFVRTILKPGYWTCIWVFPTCITGAQVLEPSSAVLPGALAWSLIRSEAAGTQTTFVKDAGITCNYWTLRHNTSLYTIEILVFQIDSSGHNSMNMTATWQKKHPLFQSYIWRTIEHSSTKWSMTGNAPHKIWEICETVSWPMSHIILNCLTTRWNGPLFLT